MDALEKELKKVNKALSEAKLKLLQATKLEKAFIEVNRRTMKLEAEVERLKDKVSKAKENSVTKFKESDTYKFDLTKTAIRFQAKTRIKMTRFLRRLH